MRCATNVCSPDTSSNAPASIIAWSDAPSANWRERFTYESDQRRLETGAKSPAAGSFRRPAVRAVATRRLHRALRPLFSSGRWTSGDVIARAVRLVFLEVVGEQQRTAAGRQHREWVIATFPGGGTNPGRT